MKLFDFLFAARPLLHLPVWTVYLVTKYYLSDNPEFDLSDLISLLALSLLFAGAFYYNQIHDEESDRQNKKLGFLQGGFISTRAMMNAFYLVSTLGVILGWLVSPRIGLLMLGLLLLSIIYSHPRIRLKDRPFSGLLANMLAHGTLVSMAAHPYPELSLDPQKVWFLYAYFSLTVGSIYLMTTLADAKGDRTTGKKTMTVAIGPRLTMLLALLLSLGATMLVYYFSPNHLLAGLALFASLLIITALLTRQPPIILLSTKLPLLLLTLLAGCFYCGYLLFVIALLIATRIYYRRRFDLVYPKLA